LFSIDPVKDIMALDPAQLEMDSFYIQPATGLQFGNNPWFITLCHHPEQPALVRVLRLSPNAIEVHRTAAKEIFAQNSFHIPQGDLGFPFNS
jgi:hypothetical protein